MEDSSKYPLTKVCEAWRKKVKLAIKFKKSHFQDDADLAMKFFCAAKELSEHMWGDRIRVGTDDEDETPAPRFRINVMKVAELVQIVGPSLYHRNPTNIVEPKILDIPVDLLMKIVPPEVIQQAQMQAQMEQREFNPESLFPPDPKEAETRITAILLQYVINYLQFENDKKTHSRRMIEEALIKGAGCVWTEQYEVYEGGPKMIGSFHDTVDNLIIDPDAQCIDDALWIGRRCVKPLWEVGEKFGIDEEYLKKQYGTHESADSQGTSELDSDGDRKRQIGESNDLIEYWEIYSRMGMGHKLRGLKGLDEAVEETLDSFGKYTYLAIASKVPFPLNLNPKLFRKAMKDESRQEEAFVACSWPIPFWTDGAWPVTVQAFHEVPNNPWPMAHIKPGLPYLEFITWGMSFLVNRLRTSCRTVVSAMASIEDTELAKITSGKDFEMIKVTGNVVPDGDIRKAVHFVEIPATHVDVWKVLEAAFDLFDKATGLTELMYAASGGMRSAKEAGVKQAAMSVRPEDMANSVEDTMSRIARKEAMALRWMWEKEDVQPIIGERGADLWERFVMTGDIDKVAREFNYRIEAGSTRKPNKETRVDQINQALQQWGTLIQWALQTGNHQLVNSFLKNWCEAMDMESKPFLLPPPPPPPPDPNQAKIEAEIAIKQKESELKQQEMQAKLQMEGQKLGLQLQSQQAKTQADMQAAAMKMEIEKVKASQAMQLNEMEMQSKMRLQQQEMEMGAAQKSQEMQMSAAQKQQELQQGAQQHALGLQQSAQQGQQKLALGEQQAKAKIQQTKAAAAAKPKPAAKKKPKGKK